MLPHYRGKRLEVINEDNLGETRGYKHKTVMDS